MPLGRPVVPWAKQQLQRRIIRQLGWTLASVGLFVAIWELLWLIGWADPKLLPPPHVFLGDIPQQAKFFNTVHRWQIGVARRRCTRHSGSAAP